MHYATPAPYPSFDGSQACTEIDPEVFFSVGKQARKPPRGVAELCEGCPFYRPCLAYALTHSVEGIWAGTTERRRQQLRGEYGVGRPIPMVVRVPTLSPFSLEG